MDAQQPIGKDRYQEESTNSKKFWTIAISAIIVILIASFVIFYFGGTKNTEIDDRPITGKVHDVVIKEFAFSPAELNITIGDGVVWKNNDAVAHDITFDSGGTGPGRIAAGEIAPRVFTKEGIYDYHCELHPEMKGRIIVE